MEGSCDVDLGVHPDNTLVDHSDSLRPEHSLSSLNTSSKHTETRSWQFNTTENMSSNIGSSTLNLS